MGYTKKRTFGLSSILAILATVVMLMKELSSRSNFFYRFILFFTCKLHIGPIIYMFRYNVLFQITH